MRKKDHVFWTATAIFLLSLALAGITRNQLWLFLMVASYLLRPTLASFGIARRSTDERQMSIQYRSGNIAFAVMMATSIGLAIWLNAHDDKSWEMFNIVIMLGLATKALFNVLLQKNYREVGSRIIIAAGLLALLFVTAENGLSLNGLIEAVPWLDRMALPVIPPGDRNARVRGNGSPSVSHPEQGNHPCPGGDISPALRPPVCGRCVSDASRGGRFTSGPGRCHHATPVNIAKVITIHTSNKENRSHDRLKYSP
jgi:hypothetical protein